MCYDVPVALRKESVDRNDGPTMQRALGVFCRSPQGERG